VKNKFFYLDIMLLETLHTAINAACKTSKTQEGINGVTYSNGSNGSDVLAAFILLIIYVLFILIIGKFLWNVVLCKLISIAKPADSIWQILGLAILLNLLYA